MKNLKIFSTLSIILFSGFIFSACTSQQSQQLPEFEPAVDTQPIMIDDAQEMGDDLSPVLEDVSQRVISLQEIAVHNTADDCWLAIQGKVYDVTEFIASGQHSPMIVNGCGLDATRFFEGQPKHSQSPDLVEELRASFQIGVLE